MLTIDFNKNWEQHETWYNFLKQIRKLTGFWSNHLQRSTPLVAMKSLRTWALMEFGITCGRWMDFATYQVFLAALFSWEKMNRLFLPWQVCLEVPSWESLDPSWADNGAIWQNTNVSACFGMRGTVPYVQKWTPKFHQLKYFERHKLHNSFLKLSHGHFELHFPCLWTSQFPFRISDGRGQALHTQTQVPQQEIWWRPISISCAKTRKSSLPKRFKDHHNQFLFG